MDSINWGKLVAQGRAKAYGVPWSDEELKALASGVSAEELRKGKVEVKEMGSETLTTTGKGTFGSVAAPEVETPTVKEEKPKAKRGRKPKK